MDKWLRNNTVVKIVAFSLALMLWLMLNLEDQAAPGQPVNDMKSLTIERVKVNIRYDESVYTIVEEPAPVTIELEGKRSLLNQLSLKPDTYEVFVDVTGLNSGRHQVPVQIAGFPDGINVTVNPTDVELVVQKKTTVNKEVHVDLVGQPKEGYVAGEPVVTPSHVEVTLPQEQVESISVVKVALDINGMDQQTEVELDVQVFDQEGKLFSRIWSPSSVTVTVPIHRLSKNVPVRYNTIGRLPDGLAIQSLTFSPERIRMYGTQESLNRINEYQGPTVDLSKIDSSGTYTYEIPLQGTIKEIAPQQASMKVEVVSAVTKEFQDIPIHVEGKGEDTEVVFVSPGNGTFDLMLEGAPEKLDALKPEDLRAYINIEDYSNGTYGLPLSVDLPPHIHISRDLPVVNVVIQSPSG